MSIVQGVTLHLDEGSVLQRELDFVTRKEDCNSLGEGMSSGVAVVNSPDSPPGDSVGS